MSAFKKNKGCANKTKSNVKNSKGGFYFPSKEDYKNTTKASIKVINQKGEVELSSYEDYIGPFYWDVEDLVDSETRNKILARRKESKQSIIIGVPTYKSGSYISRFIKDDIKKRDLISHIKVIKKAHPNWDIELVINLTISDNKDKTEQVIRKIQMESLEDVKLFSITLITIPVRAKVNAMNSIAEYAKRKKATVLCFIDDDALHYPNNALLSNIETLLKQDDLAIIGSSYDPGEPHSLWERLRSLRFRYKLNNTVAGESIFLDTECYPKIPYFLNSDDLYLTAFFLHTKHKNPFKRVIINREAYVLSKLAGNKIYDGFKLLFRSHYGMKQLLSFLPHKKSVCMREELLSQGGVFSVLDLIKLKEVKIDIPLLFVGRWIHIPPSIMIGTELRFRKYLNIPKKTIKFDKDFSTFNEPLDKKVI